MRTLQDGNWYQGGRWVTVSRKKNKNREELGGCGLVLGQVILNFFFSFFG